MTTTTPRIYVASLSAYNSGILHGEWIDLDGDADDVRDAIAAMLEKCPTNATGHKAEEWAIHDYEGMPGYRVSETEDIDRLVEWAELADTHGDAVWAFAANNCGGPEDFEDAYAGEWDDLADYAAELVEDCYGDALKSLPDFLRYHIDWEGVGRDMELNGDITTADAPGGTVYVFRNV